MKRIDLLNNFLSICSLRRCRFSEIYNCQTLHSSAKHPSLLVWRPSTSIPTSLTKRMYMSVRDRPSHSRMFGKDGKIIPLKEPPRDGKGRRFFYILIGGILAYYALKRPSPETGKENDEEDDVKQSWRTALEKSSVIWNWWRRSSPWQLRYKKKNKNPEKKD